MARRAVRESVPRELARSPESGSLAKYSTKDTAQKVTPNQGEVESPSMIEQYSQPSAFSSKPMKAIITTVAPIDITTSSVRPFLGSDSPHTA